MKPLNLKPRSGGFTLIELLVVIAIIGILGTLAAGAVFRVRGSQEQKATEVAVTKLASTLDMHFKASMDMVRETPIPPLLLGRADNDSARARAIMCKLRLRADFPQTLAEARSPSTLAYQDYLVAPSSTFRVKLQNVTSLSDPNFESAVCLSMILSQARRGVMFDAASEMGAGGIGSVNATGPSGATKLPVFVDKQGSPIGFRRWAVNSGVEASILAEISGNRELTPNANRADPCDPEARLIGNWSGASEFDIVFPGLRDNTKNFSPFVFSMGKNKLLDGSDGDDIFSFRLRKSGQRGGN